MEANNWYESEDFWISTSSLLNNKARIENGPIFVEKLINFAGMKPTQTVLDLGCGIGKFTIELSKKGLHATGMDITEAYLTIGNEMAINAGLSIDFLNCDMRQLNLPNSFDFIMILGNSFGFFDDMNDDVKVLRNVLASLKNSGKFIIEIYGKEILASNFSEKSVFDGDEYTIITDSEILNDWSWIINRLRLIKNNTIKEVSYSHRLFSAVEIKNMLYDAGFTHVDVYGNLNKSPYDNRATGLFVIAEK